MSVRAVTAIWVAVAVAGAVIGTLLERLDRR